MTTYREANQVRLKLKMKLSQYYWYNSSLVLPTVDGFFVSVNVKKMDAHIRKIIPPLLESVSVRIEHELS